MSKGEIGLAIASHIGLGRTTIVEMMHRDLGVEITIVGISEREPKEEFEFRNKIPIEVIQVSELSIGFFDREPRFYGKQTKFRNNYLNHKKKYKTLRRNDRVIK